MYTLVYIEKAVNTELQFTKPYFAICFFCDDNEDCKILCLEIACVLPSTK